MRIAVYSEGTVKAATTAALKSSRQNILGVAHLDMSSFIGADSTPQIFLIPVRSQKRRNRDKGNDLVGWIVIGLQYLPLSVGIPAIAMTSTELQTKSGAAWLSILLDPSIVTGGFSIRNSESSCPKSLGVFPTCNISSPLTASCTNSDAVALRSEERRVGKECSS